MHHLSRQFSLVTHHTRHSGCRSLSQFSYHTLPMFYRPSSFSSSSPFSHPSFSQYLTQHFPSTVISPAIFSLFPIISPTTKYSSTTTTTTTTAPSSSVSLLCSLDEERALIQLKGRDTLHFLQGLVTNHVMERFGNSSGDNSHNSHSGSGSGSSGDQVVMMNAAMLNSRGRIIYDVLLSSVIREGGQSGGSEKQQVIYVECDKKVVNHLVNHLKRCRVRAKVDISLLDTSLYSVNVLLGSDVSRWSSEQVREACIGGGGGGGSQSIPVKVYCAADPRLSAVLGQRVYCFFPDAQSKIGWMEGMKNSASPNSTKNNLQFENNGEVYRQLRILVGVSEGASEMIPDESLPLDNNYDLLKGVDWHKGCYVGQELTARSHFTGQVRKRVFPLVLDPTSSSASSPSSGGPEESDVRMQVGDKIEFCQKPGEKPITSSGRRERSAGKIIASAMDGQIGLGIVRYETVLGRHGQPPAQALRLNSNGIQRPLTIVQPFWMNDKDLFQEEEEEEDDEEEEFEFEEEYEDTAQPQRQQ